MAEAPFRSARQVRRRRPAKPETPPRPTPSRAGRSSRPSARSRANYAEQIIGACVDRTTVQGFRTAADRDTDGDKEARRLWDANDLDVKGDKAISDSYTYGRGYLLADPLTKKARHYQPWQALVVEERRRGRAGLCVEHNPTEGRDYAYLYLRDVDDNGVGTGKVYVHIAVRDRDNRSDHDPREPVLPRDPPHHLHLPAMGLVEDGRDRRRHDPAHRLPQPRRLGRVREAHGRARPDQPHLLQRVVVATMQAFKQRGDQGAEFKKHDEDGNVIDYDEMFPADIAALWLLPENADIWESGTTGLQDLLSAVRTTCATSRRSPARR